jgi:hypothetical protein
VIDDVLSPRPTQLSGHLDGATKGRLRALTGEIARQRSILHFRTEPCCFDDIKLWERWFDRGKRDFVGCRE